MVLKDNCSLCAVAFFLFLAFIFKILFLRKAARSGTQDGRR